jgi:hypothetical protein
MSMTPRTFSFMVKRYKDQVKRQELSAGIIASTIVNYSMARPEDGACPADYMPSEIASRKQMSDTEKLRRDLFAAIQAQNPRKR